ncbi:sialic acid-binding Ig-like lectin 14 [Bubalus kerabau]|uniref:sialic acid-binding Ig-like lectin 14 n=1 Tax=Bubalus carabanensis TaxID=3119969 RepID=UPI00244EDFA5|nr:sialic acid-binding Ig-like lectin 14 [Bubalus carabanensis]
MRAPGRGHLSGRDQVQALVLEGRAPDGGQDGGPLLVCSSLGRRPRHPPAQTCCLPLLLPLLWAGSLAQDPNYWLKAPRSVLVQESLYVRVPCSVSYPQKGWNNSDPAHGYWFQKPAHDYRDPAVATNNPEPEHVVLSETQGRFLLLGDPRTKDCSLDIRDAQRRDTGVYFFRLERGPTVKYNYKWHPLSVRVTALTDTPDILVQGTLASGHPTNLTCAVPWACEMGTPPTFSWTGITLTSLHPKSPHSSVLTLTPQPQDHSTNLTCHVSFPGAGVSTEATIRLDVSFPKILSNATSLRVWEGQSLHLVCVIDSNPPTNVSWSRGSLTLSPSQPLDPGVLELPQVVLGDGGEVTCRAQHPSGSSLVSLNLVVLGVSSFCPQDFGENQGSWPLVLTLLRGTLMGAGFLLTCGLSWIYYTRSVDKEVLENLA